MSKLRMPTGSPANYRGPFIAAIIAMIVVLWLYIDTFRGWQWLISLDIAPGFKVSESEWGAFGDYFGGVLNPIIGLLTIWFLGKTLRQGQMAAEANQIALQAQVGQAERHSNIQTATILLESYNRQIREAQDYMKGDGANMGKDSLKMVGEHIYRIGTSKEKLEKFLGQVEKEILASINIK